MENSRGMFSLALVVNDFLVATCVAFIRVTSQLMLLMQNAPLRHVLLTDVLRRCLRSSLCHIHASPSHRGSIDDGRRFHIQPSSPAVDASCSETSLTAEPRPT